MRGWEWNLGGICPPAKRTRICLVCTNCGCKVLWLRGLSLHVGWQETPGFVEHE
jgi:hypothetical protein